MISLKSKETDPIEGLKILACFSQIYRFFDIDVCIKTNVKEILQGFDRIYWRFRKPEENAKALPFDPEITIGTLGLTDMSDPGLKDLFIIEKTNVLTVICQETVQVLEHQGITPNLYLFIFSYILPYVKSHFLVHAATLSYRNKATIITAHSTTGKTTLAVELVKRGIKFLSDELAPIHRVTHNIDPFPRSIGLRNLKLHHLENLAQDKIHRSPNAKGEIKWMIDPEDLHSNAVGDSCPCQNIIFIEPQYEEDISPESRQVLEITLTRLPQSLHLAIKRIAGVIEVEIVQDRIFPLLRLVIEKEAHILQEVEESTKVYQSAIVSVVYGKTRKPDFNLPPVLKPMTKFEGTFELAKMILNAHSESSLMDDFDQSPARMLSHLADVTQSFQFYKLMVGKLDLMTDIVEKLIKQG